MRVKLISVLPFLFEDLRERTNLDKEEQTMNNKIEVIGIDHGWSNIKTSSQVFVTGVKEITTEPALFNGVLEYKGRYYKVGGNRQEVKSTKTEDDTFYFLTLAAVAKELRRRGLCEAKVFLAVGLLLCGQHDPQGGGFSEGCGIRPYGEETG